MEEIITLIPDKLNWKIIFLLCTLILIPNILTITFVELSFDEAYYWIYSQFLDFGHYDHPPMVGLLIKVGTTLFGQNEFGVRIPFLILELLTFVVVYKSLEKKEIISFLVMMLSMPLINFSGLVALPDTPLMFFTACFFYSVKKYLKVDNIQTSTMVCLSIVGMFYSKYHGLLIVLLTTCAHLPFIKRKSFWAIVIVVIALFLPHMYWQYTHEFITFDFHLNKRVEKHFDIMNILNYIGGQFVLMGGPLVILFIKKMKLVDRKDHFNRILAANSLFFILFLFLMSFRNQIEANWTISCSIALIILFTDILSSKVKELSLYASFNILLISGVRVFLLILPFLTLGDGYERLNELSGWKTRVIPDIIKTCARARVVADSYQVAAKVSFYTNQLVPALHLGSRDSQFGIENIERSISKDESICYLTSKKLPDTVKIDTFYKDPVYVLQKTTLNNLAQMYGTTYEEIIRK